LANKRGTTAGTNDGRERVPLREGDHHVELGIQFIIANVEQETQSETLLDEVYNMKGEDKTDEGPSNDGRMSKDWQG